MNSEAMCIKAQNLIGFTVNDGPSDYKITAELQDNSGGEMTVQSKYIIGADGGHSPVRTIADVPVVGDIQRRISATLDPPGC